MSDLLKRLNVTTLRSKSKEDLVNTVLDLYREIDQIIDAMGCIQSDIELLCKGEAYRVHDNP